MYEPKTYRHQIKDADLTSFTVTVKETDLYIRASRNLNRKALKAVSKYRDAIEILSSVSERTQFEPGCVYSRLYQDVNDERITLLEELWLTLEDLQRHLQSENYRKMLLVIELASEPPEIRFDTIAQTSGMETIEQARIQRR